MKEKKELKVGDRVAWSTHYSGTISSIESNGVDNSVEVFLQSKQECRTLRGVITAIVGEAVQVKWGDKTYSAVHIRNLRRLKPRAKAREVWAVEQPGGEIERAYFQTKEAANNWALKIYPQSVHCRFVRFREVRRK